MSTRSVIPGFRQRPLMMQLGLASAALLQPNISKVKEKGKEFWGGADGLAAKSTMEKVIEGIGKYQSHPYQRPLLHKSVIWSDGQARLIWHAAKMKGRRKTAKAQIFMIPSMINGAEILDILPKERSFISWLTKQGYDVFMLEWEHMCEDQELQTLDLTIGTKITKAIEWLRHEKPFIPMYGLGYCMGGLLLAATEILNPDFFDGLVFVATPWDFSGGGKNNISTHIRNWANEGGLLKVIHQDYMPNEWLQLIFAGTDPSMITRKFSSFADLDITSDKAKLFVAVEDWVNGGADLPAGIVRQAVNDWYIHNKPASGKWRINRKIISAKKIKKPALVVIPSNDTIVHPNSAKALAKQLPNATTMTVDFGHISMMMGAKAEEGFWTPLKLWMEKNL